MGNKYKWHWMSRTYDDKKNHKVSNTIFYTSYGGTNNRLGWHKDYFKLKTFGQIASIERKKSYVNFPFLTRVELFRSQLLQIPHSEKVFSQGDDWPLVRGHSKKLCKQALSEPSILCHWSPNPSPLLPFIKLIYKPLLQALWGASPYRMLPYACV